MSYYHVTLMDNLKLIRKQGLIPKLGERSIEFGEKEPMIFLFPRFEYVENALLQWLGEWYYYKYGEDIPIAILEVNLPKEFPIEQSHASYEVMSRKNIPAKYITLLKVE